MVHDRRGRARVARVASVARSGVTDERRGIGRLLWAGKVEVRRGGRRVARMDVVAACVGRRPQAGSGSGWHYHDGLVSGAAIGRRRSRDWVGSQMLQRKGGRGKKRAERLEAQKRGLAGYVGSTHCSRTLGNAMAEGWGRQVH